MDVETVTLDPALEEVKAGNVTAMASLTPVHRKKLQS